MTLAGLRLHALSRVAALLDRAQTGAPAFGMLTGEAGMGKSVLAGEARRIATERSFVTVTVHSYGGATNFIRMQVSRQLALPDVTSDEDGLMQIRLGLQQLDRTSRGTLLIFEDVDRYNADELAIIQDLLRAPPGRHIAILCTMRSQVARNTAVQPVNFLDRIEPHEHIDLYPLTLQETSHLIRWCSPAESIPARFIRDVYDFTIGNPLHVVSLILAIHKLPLADRQALIIGSQFIDSAPLALPLINDIRERIALAEPASRALLEAMSVFQIPASTGDLEVLLEEPLGGIQDALETLDERGFVKLTGTSASPLFMVSRPLVSVIVASDVPPIRRRRLHQRSAEILQLRSGSSRQDMCNVPVLQEATHYLLGALTLTEEHIGTVVSAARDLIDQSRFAAAQSLITQLLQRLDDENSLELAPAEASILLAETLSRGGASGEARRALSKVTTGIESHEDSVATIVRLARDEVSSGRSDSARELYRSVLRESLPYELRANLLIDAARVDHSMGDIEDAFEKLSSARDLARKANDIHLEAHCLIQNAFVLTWSGRPMSGLDLARRGHALSRQAKAPVLIARAMTAIGDSLADTAVERGARWLRRAARLAEQCGDYATVSAAAFRLATACVETGDWREAHSMAALAANIDASLHREHVLRRSHAFLRSLMALTGEAELPGAPLQTDRSHGPAVFVPEFIAQFEQQMLHKRHTEAFSTITEAHKLLERIPGWERLLVAEVLPRKSIALMSLGSIRGLNELLSELERLEGSAVEMAPLVPASIQQVRGQLALLGKRWGEALTFATGAATEFGAAGYRYRRALALSDSAHAWIGLKNPHHAAVALEEAYRILDRSGAKPRLHDIRLELSALNFKVPPSIDESRGLSERQWQVVQLASRGLTDAKIADALAISRRTVTTHIHNILQVTGLSSRSQFVEWIELHELERARAIAGN